MAERYLPLYRKYRPQTFHDLIGQENIVKSLSNAIKLGKISHAYLLCGPRGTGKTSSARILAKSLNCAEGPTLTPCGKCPSCLDIMNSTPIDVVEIDAASNRKVEDARNILEKIQFVPVNGRYKIYIIDEVHMLTTEAFNTLLKTLEEPPENVIFILATTEPHKVLETIISRCQRFDFRRITTEDIVNHLEKIAQKENIKISKDALFTIARSSAGGMRDSLALLDQLSVMDAQKEITADDVNEMLGRLSFDTLFEISKCIFEADSQTAITLLDKIYNKGNEPYQIVSNMIMYFRNMLIVKNCADRNIAMDLTQLSEQNILKLREQVENIEVEQLIYLIERLSFYSKEIRETTNRYLWLELCVIELTSNVKYATYSQLIERIEALEAGNVSTPASSTISAVQMKKPEQFAPAPPVFAPKSESAEIPAPAEPAPKAEIEEKTPISPVSEPAEPVETQSEPESVPQQADSSSGAPAADGDMSVMWGGILGNIESMPSRMFFYNLSRPVSISPEELVISFAKEIFVKQAKEDSKNLPLKKAAMAYFNVNDINLTIKLADASDSAPVSPKLTQIIEKKNEPAPKSREIIEKEIEEENAEALSAEIAPPAKEEPKVENYSDQTRMVLDLFNGKIID